MAIGWLTTSFPGAIEVGGRLSPIASGQTGGVINSARASAQELYARGHSTFTQVEQVLLEKVRVQSHPEMALRAAKEGAQQLYERDKAGLSQVGGGAKFSPLVRVSLDGGAVRRRESELEQVSRPDQSAPWRLTDRGVKIETNKPQASLAVVDAFGTQTSGRPDHGEITSALALKAGQLEEQDLLRVDIQTQTKRAQASMPGASDPRPFGEKLDAAISSFYTAGADVTTEAMQEIREHHPSISTVSQSHGASALTVTNSLLMMGQSPEFAANLRSELQLPPDMPLRQPEALVALAGRVQATLSSSAAVEESRQSLNAELDQARGQRTFYQSAGNEGELQDELAKAGFQFDPQWVLAPAGNHPNTITVGAGIAQGDLGKPADYTQRAEVDFAVTATTFVEMDGQPVCGNPQSTVPCQPFEGSSFSAPWGAGLFRNDPESAKKLPQGQTLPPQPGSLGLGWGLIQR